MCCRLRIVSCCTEVWGGSSAPGMWELCSSCCTSGGPSVCCDVAPRLGPTHHAAPPCYPPHRRPFARFGYCGDVSTYPRTVLYVVGRRPPLGHLDASTAREHTRSTLLGRTQKLRVNGHPGTAAHTPTTPHICQGFSLAVLLHSTPVANHRRTRASAHCESSPSHTHACRMIVVVHAFTVRSQKVQHFNAFI